MIIKLRLVPTSEHSNPHWCLLDTRRQKYSVLRETDEHNGIIPVIALAEGDWGSSVPYHTCLEDAEGDWGSSIFYHTCLEAFDTGNDEGLRDNYGWTLEVIGVTGDDTRKKKSGLSKFLEKTA